MNYFFQIITSLSFLALFTKLSKLSSISFLLLVSVPIIYFYPFSISTLVLSLLLALTLKNLLVDKRKYLNILLFTIILTLSIFISGHKIFNEIVIENVTNSQRGEHPNYQTSITAKILHNKTTTVMYYLQNLNDRLSISTVFASGSYPNLSKHLPIGFLFPWYLLGFLLSIRTKYKDYLNFVFLSALSLLFLLTGVLTRGSADIFMFSIIWFICIESVEQIQKLPKLVTYFIFTLNLAYLSIILMSLRVFLNK